MKCRRERLTIDFGWCKAAGICEVIISPPNLSARHTEGGEGEGEITIAIVNSHKARHSLGGRWKEL